MLKVNFPFIGEYDYDANEKVNCQYENCMEKEMPDDFWASYDPFEPYDHFNVQETCESFEKWKAECLNEALGDPHMSTSMDPMLHDLQNPKKQPSSDNIDLKNRCTENERFKISYHQVPVKNASCFLFFLRILACLVLAVALYCFCNGYQEVKFLEIVNKCLEGHHNPMCEGFMEPENTMNEYRPITVQEDMYADRMEWIPKQMNPSQEYITLVNILERHPCQSLRCLDKLTAQIYGGNQSKILKLGMTQIVKNDKQIPGNWIQKPEYKDRMDDVLKQLGHYRDTKVELKEEMNKKNREYLVMKGSVEVTSRIHRLVTNSTFHGTTSVENQNEKDVQKLKKSYVYPIQNLVPDELKRDASILSAWNKSQIFDKELVDKADILIKNQGTDIHNSNSENVLFNKVSALVNTTSKKFGRTNVDKLAFYHECAGILTSHRFDCHPEAGASEAACVNRNCCWRPVEKLLLSPPGISPPYCYYPPSYVSYHAIHHQDTPTGQEALLQLVKPSGHAGDQQELRLQAVYETDTRLKIQINPTQGLPSPLPVLPLPPGGGVLGVVNHDTLQYRVTLALHDAAITVTRTQTNATLFSTRGAAPLVFAQHFMQVSSVLSSASVYGLGQHRNGLLLDVDWTQYILWNADQPPEPGLNLYGSHPFYLVMESSGDSYGVFIHSSNAMSAVLQPSPAVTLLSTGSSLTLYILTGPTPSAVISQYSELVGRPSMPPYWALGYHQCRFGYGSLAETMKVWQRTRDAGIPFDVQWNDIDYMAKRNDFTYDKEKFAGLPQFVEQLHQAGMHYVPIIDPGISNAEVPGSYPPFDEGNNMGVFVRNASGQLFVGKVWNSVSTVWPDFSHPRSLYYWARQFVRFHSDVPFDGAWIDMNEPSNFYSGTARGCNTSDPLNAPPYVPAVVGGKLYFKTLCGDAKHYGGRHFDLHNLYGNMEAVATNIALKVTRGERPLVISRASYPGLGVWAGHWTGDVTSDWDNLRASVPDVLNFNLFGIPLVGADICGFNGNTTASLCLRWMQLGAFYPFSRNHNTDDAIDQDPVSLGPAVVAASRTALQERYRLLPYLYTLFYRAHALGETVARPLFVEFPQDSATYSISRQFLWGSGLMVVPALDENVTEVSAYLPCGSEWYDWYSGVRVTVDERRGGSSEGRHHNSSGDGDVVPGCYYTTLAAPLDRVPLLVRGGAALPTQPPAPTTTLSREGAYTVVVALDQAGAAHGQLYVDDGVSIDPVSSRTFTLLDFRAEDHKLIISSDITGYKGDMVLDGVRVLGVQGVVESVTVNGEPRVFTHHEQVLLVRDLKWTLPLYFVMSW